MITISINSEECMPTYCFKDNNTNETFEKRLSMSEREQFLKNNPHLTQVPVLSNLSFDDMRGKKIDDGFKDVLKNIQQKAIGGQYMQSRYL